LNSNRNINTSFGICLIQTSESYFNVRMLAVSVSYNFGNAKSKKADIKKKQNSQDSDMEDMEQ